MTIQFSPVFIWKPGLNGSVTPVIDSPVSLVVEILPHGILIKIRKDPRSFDTLFEVTLTRTSEWALFGQNSFVITIDGEGTVFRFKSESDLHRFYALLQDIKNDKDRSVFAERTDESSAMQYFQFYGYLSQQQNMLQDYVRTSTYQRAVLLNSEDFKDKIVLDVGAGSGILSFFAVQAGAKKVYAVEASSMAIHAEVLVAANNFQDKIQVIAGKIEEIDLPELVDVIISEPMGYMLYNERMLETYLHAKKWLKPGGIMFPSKGDLHIAPFTDDSLHMELTNKANFWVQTCFHGVDLSSMRDAATKEYFRQPIVDTFDIRICMAKSVRHSVDFSSAKETDLHNIVIPLDFHILDTGTVHGLAFWFDVAFTGSTQTVWLSTSPTEALTHWYQVRCLLETPIFAKAGQLLKGTVTLQANQRQSYDVTIDLNIEGVENSHSVNTLDLKNPYFRYSGQPAAPPPGTNTTSPSEAYWSTLDAQGARQAVNMVTGISVNGLGEVSLDSTGNQLPSNILGIVTQPNIHPGSISSTGRQRGTGFCQNTQTGAVGGVVAPSLFGPTASPLVIGQASHFPVNSSLMIGDYVTPGNNVLNVHGYRT